jgi:RHS repeat-associated protein
LEVVYSTEATTRTVYFLKDHLGSIRATVLDSAGAPVIGYDDYDPWGYPLAQRTKPIPNAYLQGASKNKFTGKERDEEFGLNLDYFGGRYYDWLRGQWISRDPLAQKYPSWSPYHYALDNPIRFYDIDGRDIRNATKNRPVVVIGDTKNPAQPAYVILGPGERTEGLEGDFDFYRFAGDEDATWYKVSISNVIDVDVTETGEPKVTNLLGKILKELPKIHVRKATPEESEAATIIQQEVERKKREEEERRKEEERKKQEEERRKQEEKRKEEEQKKENERQ